MIKFSHGFANVAQIMTAYHVIYFFCVFQLTGNLSEMIWQKIAVCRIGERALNQLIGIFTE